MQFKDYYQTLGVDKEATQDQIKQAYRRLARKYHPDVSQEADAEERFKAVGEANEVLKDPEKRAAYDQLGSQWQAGQEFKPPPDWDAGFEYSGGDESAFSDFFDSLFGQARSGGRGAPYEFDGRGRDHHAKVVIDLEDAYTGAPRQITLQAPYVDGTGHIRTRERTLNVRIPKGVVQGQHVRLAGLGDPGTDSAKAGDLFLEVQFRPHGLYRVQGRDVHIDVPVAPWELALGAQVKVPTPAGKVEVTVPASSQSGDKLRLAGRGIPGKKSGDLYVVLRVIFPQADSEKGRQIYQDMKKEMNFNPRERLGV
jgi:curved DNA-binding protein